MANYYVTDPSHPPPPHEHAQPPYELWSPQQRHPVDMTHSCPDNQPPTSPTTCRRSSPSLRTVAWSCSLPRWRAGRRSR